MVASHNYMCLFPCFSYLLEIGSINLHEQGKYEQEKASFSYLLEIGSINFEDGMIVGKVANGFSYLLEIGSINISMRSNENLKEWFKFQLPFRNRLYK